TPTARPLGGNEVGIKPAASFAEVTEASIIFEVVTELSANLFVVTAAMAMVGSGYVPERSPPAGPPLVPALSIPGAHCVPLNFNTLPVVGLARFTAMPESLFTVGLGPV